MSNLTQTITLLSSDDEDKVVGKEDVILESASFFQGARRSIGIVEETIEINVDIDNAGFFYIHNEDPMNFVMFGFSSGDYPMRAYPNEQGCVPLKPTIATLYLCADTAACIIKYEVTSRDDINLVASPSATPTASVSATPTATPTASPSPT